MLDPRKRRKKEGIDREIAALADVPIQKTTLVSEGGDREVNGRGTLMAIEETEMQRNPGTSRDGMEQELLRVLGQKKKMTRPSAGLCIRMCIP